MTTQGKPPQVPQVHLQAAMQAVLDKTNDESDTFHFAARAFRNRLLITSAIIITVSASLVVIQGQLATLPIIALPKDVAHNRWGVMLLIMAFGSVGALVSAIPSMASLPSVSSPYNFPIQQALVKVFLGSLTATVGVIAIGNTGIAKNGFTSLQALLGVAVIFGAGQQAVTRFLDERAQKILASAP